MKNSFTIQLLQWNKTQNNRQMPWKGQTDPYKIWLSEIILQQTRVAQGLAYYNNFIKTFPTIKKLAAAPESQIMKMWEGLGYYSRCRNLIATAKIVVEKYNGIFPTAYEDVLALKGIGPYTAAAIVSFSYNQPYAVLDGNVFRVLSRYMGNGTPIDSTEGKKLFAQMAQELLDKQQPAAHNQAIMDFGATVCTPQNPCCSTCPLQSSCVAYQTNTIATLPSKTKKLVIKERFFHYLIIECGKEILVRKRNTNDVWKDLHEFYLIEKKAADFEKKILLKGLVKPKPTQVIWGETIFTQKLTHQTIKAKFTKIKVEKKSGFSEYYWIKKSELNNLPFPALINQYFSNEKKLN